MKKFLVILMVLAMASFLFVGCTTPVEEDVVVEEEEEEEEVVVVAATVAPVLLTVAGISLTSSATQYINATEAAVVIVTGTAPTYSEVKVYVDDVCAGTADVGVTGTFSVTVAEADLGADGDKVIYATAEEGALDVSAHSVEYAFVLDQVAPGIDSVAFSASVTASLVDSAVATVTSGASPVASIADNALIRGVAGTWTIYCLGDSTEVSNVVVTTPAGVATTHSVNALAVEFITGLTVTLEAAFDAGDGCNVVVTPGATAIAGRATITFDEDVDYTGMTAGTYAGGLVAVDPTTYKETNDTGYWTGYTVDAYNTYTITTYGITDLAGNVGGTSATPLAKSAVATAASATSLAP